ncbi:uncharacterized protein MELLADRAFT_77151 [Melampsora larici-populina 98AG31]|uniref:Secreted protein n=1 Tax=Melampsora larici-populina (strain 98AG31 / pathotype 3-4-7) TaxID=747676 RepID=F4RE07_MELLP|nr:uncharacterized protein MELLADRAFT_77151 [Melampsora larici-populina 98AG31]EGG09523.1 hypothetical protein MELLADRAFT_77151 [Melampsora larici-populina 98AG31]
MLTPTIFLAPFIILSIFITPSLSQNTTRNIIYPNVTSTTPVTATNQTNTVSGANSLPTNAPTTNATVNGTLPNTHPNVTTATTPLQKIPDSTGINNVPVPVMSGERANGRFGPDDGYIAAVGQLIIPVSLSIGVMLFTVYMVGIGL